MIVLGDRETDSVWDHLTGECLHGELKGHQLESGDLHTMRADQVLEAYPNARLARSRLSILNWLMAQVMKIMQNRKDGFMPPFFAPTIGNEDDRLPRMEIGLGISAENTTRFYPMKLLREQAPLFDVLDGRRMIVGIDPVSKTPYALFTEASTITKSDETTLHLDSGETVQNGLLYNQDGSQVPDAITQNLFTRWYGFSLTYPGCDIYVSPT